MSRGLTFALEDLPVHMRERARAQIEGTAKPPLVAGPALQRLAKKVKAAHQAVPFEKNKYGARRVFEDGRAFGSKKEHRRYLLLVERQKAGEITGLRCHVAFALFDPGENCRGELIGRYTSDFVYKEHGKLVVEDVKSRHTAKLRDWSRTRKLFRMCHGFDIVEVL